MLYQLLMVLAAMLHLACMFGIGIFFCKALLIIFDRNNK